MRGTDPAARKPYPQRVRTVGASLVGALRPYWAPVGSEDTAGRPVRPLSYSVTWCHFWVTEKRAGHYRIEQSRRQSQLGNDQNVAESNRFRLTAFTGLSALGAR